jgi:hypothetical protein
LLVDCAIDMLRQAPSAAPNVRKSGITDTRCDTRKLTLNRNATEQQILRTFSPRAVIRLPGNTAGWTSLR